MDPKQLYLPARALVALLFFVAGIRKALAFSATAAYFERLGFPASEIVTVLVIILELGGSVALVLAWRLRDVAIGMGAYTLAAAIIGHPFWSVEPTQFAGQLNNFLKNIAITGGFLLLALQGSRSTQKS